MATMLGFMYAKSKLYPSCLNRLFFFETSSFILSVIKALGIID